MPDYLVQWEINITADSPEAAAREALRIQRDPASCATVFNVWDEDGIDTTADITALDEVGVVLP